MNSRYHKYENEWKIVSNNYSEEARAYKDKYLEIEEEFGIWFVVSVFRLKNDMYAIFVAYDKTSVVTYVDKENVYKIKEEIKKDLEENYKKYGKVNDTFLSYFNKKYNMVEMPEDFFEEIDVKKIENSEIECNSNTKKNKIMFSIMSITIISLFLFSCLISGISLEILARVLLYSLKEWYTIILILIYVLCFLRIKNFELLIKGDKIIYKNIFGIKKEYNLSEIRYYKIITTSDYRDSEGYDVSGSMTILLHLNQKRIWLSNYDSNINELLNYLEDNEIKKEIIKF